MYWRKRTGCVGGNGLDVLVAMDWMHDGDGLDARRRRTGCTTETDWMHDGDGLDARRRRTGCTNRDGLDARRRLFLDPLPSILATRGNKTGIKLPFYFF